MYISMYTSIILGSRFQNSRLPMVLLGKLLEIACKYMVNFNHASFFLFVAEEWLQVNDACSSSMSHTSSFGWKNF